MPQFGPAWVLRAVAPVLLAASSVATSDVLGATEGCVVKPSGPAPQGQHWFYRFDREAKRTCWHLGSNVARIALPGARPKSATERLNPPAADAPATSALAPQPHPIPANATAALPAPTGGAPAGASIGLDLPGWPTAGRFPEPPPTAAPRISDASERVPAPTGTPAPAIAPAPAVAPDVAPPPTSVRPARAAITGDGEGDHTFALIMIAMALLAIAGPVVHAARRRSGRKVAALSEDSRHAWSTRTVSPPAPESREVVGASALRQPAPPLSPLDRPETHGQQEHRDQPNESAQSKRVASKNVQTKSAQSKAEPKRVQPKESVQAKSDQPNEGDQSKTGDQPKERDQPKLGDQTDDLVEGLRRVVREMVAKQEVSASAA